MTVAIDEALASRTNAAPDPARDLAVRRLWRQSLGPKAENPEANILGISIGLKRIVRLLHAVETEIGVKVPATSLLRLGTVDALVAAIQKQIWPTPSPCVLMQDGDDRPPLYVFSAGSGMVLELCDLVRSIDFPGQIWGMQLPGLDGETDPLSSLPAIGRFYAEAIAERQPVGPYHLLGYSFGGSAAIETARHLAAGGRTIGLIGLIDSNLDEKNWPKGPWLAGVLRRCVTRTLDARRMKPKEAVRHIAVRAMNLARYAGRKAGGETAASIHQSSYYIGGLEPNFQKVRDCAIVAYQTYRPQRVDLPVTLFRSELGDPHACDPAPVWRQFIRQLRIVRCPGSHTTMVRLPHARILAAAILEWL